ncbi:MAG: hydroxyacylglutathione hydrolase [Pseudomonadota bacterium]
MPTVTAIPAFRDNYIWAIHDNKHAIVVDPGEAGPVEAFLTERGLELVAVLATHHHPDHVGGIADLIAHRAISVYGPAGENISTLTHRLKENDEAVIAELDLHFRVLDIPGHTAGHIAFYGHGMLFCGDTLFACGCGRLFEGTPAQMVSSLTKLTALPDETQVYCGHEYTLANIRFALAVEANSAPLKQREVTDAQKRERGEPTLPSTIGLELQTNPFLRYQEPTVIEAASKYAGRKLTDAVETFTVIREWKNQFS